MKIKVINAMFIILVLAALSALTFFVRVGATADTVVVLDIAGMTCGSCVDKIKKTLQSEQGVASVQKTAAKPLWAMPQTGLNRGR